VLTGKTGPQHRRGRRAIRSAVTSIFDAELTSGKDVHRLGDSQANAACEECGKVV
jgi:hypothetical protein